jgi:hypothetical protein
MSDAITRLKEAVVVLKGGGTIKVGDVRFGVYGDNELTVTGWTRYNSLENLTRTTALSELAEIKDIFTEMLNASPELTDFAKTKEVGYYLGQDYGQGAIGICKEISGRLVWEIKLKG